MFCFDEFYVPDLFEVEGIYQIIEFWVLFCHHFKDADFRLQKSDYDVGNIGLLSVFWTPRLCHHLVIDRKPLVVYLLRLCLPFGYCIVIRTKDDVPFPFDEWRESFCS